MKSIKINKAKKVKGVFEVDSDKSISHRAFMLAGISAGNSIIHKPLLSEDCLNTLKCLKNLGIDYEVIKTKVIIKAKGKYGFISPAKTLWAGNSGTTIRLLSGLIAGQDIIATIDGDDSLRRRPMDRISIPLTKMGARFETNNNKPPVKIYGKKPLSAIFYNLPVASAQVKSAILFAGLYADEKSIVIEPIKTRNHTELLLPIFGVNVFQNNESVGVFPVEKLNPVNIQIPGDISSASFFIAAALILPNSDITIKNVGINPTRTRFLELLIKSGAQIDFENKSFFGNEPVCDIKIKSSKIKSFVIKKEDIPLLIDEIPILSIIATQCEGTTEITGAKELRLKESDRIKTIVEGLKNIGATVEEKEDGLIIQGEKKLKGGYVNSYGDHRIAMSFVIAGLFTEGVKVENIDCINTSFPGFWRIFNKIVKC